MKSRIFIQLLCCLTMQLVSTSCSDSNSDALYVYEAKGIRAEVWNESKDPVDNTTPNSVHIIVNIASTEQNGSNPLMTVSRTYEDYRQNVMSASFGLTRDWFMIVNNRPIQAIGGFCEDIHGTGGIIRYHIVFDNRVIQQLDNSELLTIKWFDRIFSTGIHLIHCKKERLFS